MNANLGNEARASVSQVRISARKVRLVANLIRGRKVDDALTQLKFASKGVVPIMIKLLKSAQANAVNDLDMKKDRLYIREIYVNEGVSFKRVMPRARGRADRITKRSSHINIIVAES